MDTTCQKKLLCITVDVEALPSGQSSDHVNRLIWGRFGAKEAGISRMMDLAEKYGKKCTFFLDYCEKFLYPGAFEIIAGRICERGHDVQLHAHTTADILPQKFWSDRGLVPDDLSPDGFGEDRADALIEFLADCSEKMTGKAPIAFRGGNFRFNNFILEAMKRRGISLGFNYNVVSMHQPNNEINRPFFRWSNGIVEFPMGAIAWPDKLYPWRQFDFNATDLGDVQHLRTMLERYYSEVGTNSVVVMLMHSWSFCRKSRTTGFFEYQDDSLEKAFENLLFNLPPDMEVVTASELNELLISGRLTTEAVRDVSLVGGDQKNKTYPAHYAKEFANVINVSPVPEEPRECNYCRTPVGEMVDFSGGQRCPRCYSLPRQRIFLWAYERFIRQEFDLSGKKILLVCPSNALLGYLHGKANAISCDIMPVKWFELQLDICKMPDIPDASFDAVIAKSILHHCYDDEAALDEFRRVLKPWGRVFLHVSCNNNAETEVSSNVTRHYGKEALERFKVGTYRYYGDRSFLRMLQKRFLVKTFYGIDPVSRNTSTIYCGIKDGLLDSTEMTS